MRILKEKDTKNIFGGAHIDLILFPDGNTLDDPRMESSESFYKNLHIMGYAVYNDEDKYIGGFSTGVSDADLLNATNFARENNIINPKINNFFLRKNQLI